MEPLAFVLCTILAAPDLGAGLTLAGGVNGAGQALEDKPRLGFENLEPHFRLDWIIDPELQLRGWLLPDFSEAMPLRDQIEANERYELWREENRGWLAGMRDRLEVRAGERRTTDVLPFYSQRIASPIYVLGLTAEIEGTRLELFHAIDDGARPSDQPAIINVARTRMELGDNGYAGLLITNRTLADGSRVNTTAGFDAQWRWQGLEVHGRILGSHTATDDTQYSGSYFELGTEYRNQWFGVWAGVYDVSPELENDLGFINRRDYRRFDFGGDATIRPDWKIITRITPRLTYNRWVDRTDLGIVDDPAADDDLMAEVILGGPGNSELLAGFGHRTHEFEDVVQDTFVGRLRLGSAPANFLAASVEYEAANGWNYDIDDPFFGSGQRFRASVSAGPPEIGRVAFEADYYRLDRPLDLSNAIETFVIRALGTASIPEVLDLRVIAEGNPREDRLDFYVLVTMRPAEILTVNLGYTGEYPLSSGDSTHRLFAKLDFTW